MNLGWKTLLTAALQAFTALLEYLKTRRDTSFRDRVSDDGAGVLIDQLNPGRHSDASDTSKLAASDAGRGARGVDG